MIIEKSLSANTIYVTATEIFSGVTSGVTMELFNRYTNEITSLTGLTDSSQYPQRVNIYTLQETQYSGLCSGKYSYKILSSGGTIVEEGIVDIRENILTETQSVETNYTFITGGTSEYLVYACN